MRLSVHLIVLLLALQPAGRAEIFPLDSDRRALSSSFGEYRGGRLHAGIDFATFGVTGIPVRAVRGGVVHRLRSSTRGYGNVIYIRHDDGTRSVYAHLESFAPRLAAGFPRPPHPLGGDDDEKTMEVHPSPGIPVAAGERIGTVGESGSGLPHLHFEWRDANDRPLNPVTRGVISVIDRAPPVITAVWIEPADQASSVNGSAFPVNALADAAPRIRGRVRILVAGHDEDGRGGGRMAFQSVVMTIDGERWSEIEMDAFTYGRDHETDRLYDPWRTGFGPTVYTFDLTTTRGVPEIFSGRGPVPAPAGEARVAIRVTDMNGNPTETWFSLMPATRENEPASRGSDGEHIGPGGLVVERDGRAQRIVALGDGRIDESAWSARNAATGGPIPLAGGGRLLELAAGQIGQIHSLAESRRSGPPAAVARPLLIGPFGHPLGRNVQVSLPRPDGANGLMRFANDTWRWIPTRVEEDRLVASITFLAPLVAARDATPPRITLIRHQETPFIVLTDDLSGIDAESVRVRTKSGAPPRPIAGRFDPERGWFHFRRPPDRRSTPFVVEASDRAGNRTSVEFNPRAERVFRP